MRFEHCGVHHQEFHRLVHRSHGDAVRSRYPVIIGCRTCHQWYFADPAPGDAGATVEGCCAEAERRLSEECPDHAHRFVVANIAAS